MASPKELVLYNRVELLVHPFFALEHARRSGISGYSRNLTEEKALLAYEGFEIPQSWMTQVRAVKQDPAALFVLIGPRKYGNYPKTPHGEFYEGELTKSKLVKFSKTYQDFLAQTKKILGRRMVFISDNVWLPANRDRLTKVLQARGVFPAKHVAIHAYGEYLRGCVDQQGRNLKDFIEFNQKYIWEGEKTKTILRRLEKVPARKINRLLSLSPGKIEFHTKYRRVEQGGAISPLWNARNFIWPDGTTLGDVERISQREERIFKKVIQRRKR